jgi:hypothetical protein
VMNSPMLNAFVRSTSGGTVGRLTRVNIWNVVISVYHGAFGGLSCRWGVMQRHLLTFGDASSGRFGLFGSVFRDSAFFDG